VKNWKVHTLCSGKPIQRGHRNITTSGNKKIKLHVVSMDYTNTFDFLNRSKLAKKLEEIIGPSHAMTSMMKKILAYNYVTASDNRSNSK
jgi:hypothetical protein